MRRPQEASRCQFLTNYANVASTTHTSNSTSPHLFVLPSIHTDGPKITEPPGCKKKRRGLAPRGAILCRPKRLTYRSTSSLLRLLLPCARALTPGSRANTGRGEPTVYINIYANNAMPAITTNGGRNTRDRLPSFVKNGHRGSVVLAHPLLAGCQPSHTLSRLPSDAPALLHEKTRDAPGPRPRVPSRPVPSRHRASKKNEQATTLLVYRYGEISRR